jgi:hypothetical protein
LRPDTLLDLGTTYSCILRSDFKDPSIYELNIYVGPDSILASTAETYETTIELNPGVLDAKNCGGPIPTLYTIRNLPLNTPAI